MAADQYPDAVDASLVGTYPAVANAGEWIRMGRHLGVSGLVPSGAWCS